MSPPSKPRTKAVETSRSRSPPGRPGLRLRSGGARARRRRPPRIRSRNLVDRCGRDGCRHRPCRQWRRFHLLDTGRGGWGRRGARRRGERRDVGRSGPEAGGDRWQCGVSVSGRDTARGQRDEPAHPRHQRAVRRSNLVGDRWRRRPAQFGQRKPGRGSAGARRSPLREPDRKLGCIRARGRRQRGLARNRCARAQRRRRRSGRRPRRGDQPRRRPRRSRGSVGAHHADGGVRRQRRRRNRERSGIRGRRRRRRAQPARLRAPPSATARSTCSTSHKAALEAMRPPERLLPTAAWAVAPPPRPTQ